MSKRRMSKREMARQLEVSLSAVQAAIGSGRLTWPSVSVEAARAEWTANSGLQGPAPLASRGEAIVITTPPESETRAEALRRLALAKAKTADLEYRRAAGELIEVVEVERQIVSMVTAARNKLMGVPTRFRQRAPHTLDADIGVLDDLIREALEDLSAELAS